MVQHWLTFIGWMLSIVTATGNGFVIFVVAKTRRLHSSANWFVLSLAVADFGVGIAVFPSSYFCNGSMACNFRIYIAVFWFFLHSSVINLCTLTWDRYIAIVHPYRYNNSMTKRRPVLVIVIAWLISFAISLSLLVGIYATESKTVLKILRVTGVSAFDIICCGLLSYAVARILVVARAQSHQQSAMELQIQSHHDHSSMKAVTPRARRKKRNTVHFIVTLVMFFLGCYVVVNYLVLCATFSCHVSVNASQILILLLVLNSSVNPLVYACLKRDIKLELKRLICR